MGGVPPPASAPAVAAITTRIELGTLVLATGFRNPGLVAKMATTLDEVSGGRLILGLGSGDPAHDTSWEAFGYEPARAGSRHREAVEVIARLLRELSSMQYRPGATQATSELQATAARMSSAA